MAIARRLGKKPPRLDARTLKLDKYLTPLLPSPPLRVDWTRGFNINWGMMLNNELGDCTEAAKGHTVQTWTLCNGRMVVPSDSVILQAYETECGYVPGDSSTDQGGVEIDVLNAWRKNGFGHNPLSVYAAVDWKNFSHVQQAIYLFGLVYIGFNVPASAMEQNAMGQPWDVVSNDGGIVGGHAVVVPMYDIHQKLLTCLTWGQRQVMTEAFWMKYVDEVYALLSPDWLSRGNVDPSGFNLAALEADLAVVTA